MNATIPCVCSPTPSGEQPHEQDTITFRDRLDFRSGLAIRKQIALEKADDPDMSAGEILAIMTETYLIHGIESWTLVDDKRKAVEPTRAAIRVFVQEHPDEAMELTDIVDEAYQEQVLLPLLKRASTSSPQSPTPEPTSASRETSGSRSRSPKPSKPSSTSTTRTDDIEVITSLPAGGSRSSRNSATAA